MSSSPREVHQDLHDLHTELPDLTGLHFHGGLNVRNVDPHLHDLRAKLPDLPCLRARGGLSIRNVHPRVHDLHAKLPDLPSAAAERRISPSASARLARQAPGLP